MANAFKEKVSSTLAMKERELALREREILLREREAKLNEERQAEDFAERRRLFEMILAVKK